MELQVSRAPKSLPPNHVITTLGVFLWLEVPHVGGAFALLRLFGCLSFSGTGGTASAETSMETAPTPAGTPDARMPERVAGSSADFGGSGLRQDLRVVADSP